MKKIKFYNNSNAMEEERIREIIAMSPGDRIKSVVELIRRIYPMRPKTADMKKIKFLQ
jgi:ribosome maturation protein Sdo1